MKNWRSLTPLLTPLLVQFARLVLLIARRFSEDRLNRVAQALSYTTLLSLVPFTTLAFGLLSVFPVFETWMTTIQTFVYQHFVPASGDVVQRYLNQFASKSAELTAFGLLFLIVTALMLLATIEQSFNDIWRAPQKRKMLNRFLGYWAILTLGPVLVGLSLSVTSYVISLPLFKAAPFLGPVKAFLLNSLPVFAEIVAFVLLYMVVPNVQVRFRHALVGALFAAVLFELSKRGFALFVLKYSSYRLIYGAIAALPVFLIWVYFSWVITLLGAVVVALLPEWAAPASKVVAAKRESER